MENKEKKNLQKYWQKIYQKIRDITNLHEDTNIETTLESIKKDVEFKGANVWILFFAVIVCSVGLNINSTAVIIGAMLISPLMGPINGVGLAVGINDAELLRSSLKNLLIMILVGLLASTFYFLITPLSDAQSELLARTRPTIFDVLIAFFGGLAGIVAASRKEGKITVIAGVAIATALMPPLCTAGFGLATGQMKYFGGAFYLLFLNSFFIALATLLMVRYLHFPVKHFVNPAKGKVVRRTITLFSILVIIPSVFLAWNIIKESRFNTNAIRYVQAMQKLDLFTETEIINVNREYSSKGGKIYLSLIGKPLNERQIQFLQNQLAEYGLKGVQLSIKQTTGTLDIGAQTAFITNLLDKKDAELHKKDSLIQALNAELLKIKNSGIDEIQIAREVKVQFPEIEKISFSHSIFTDVHTLSQDTVATIYLIWKENPENNELIKKLEEWLKVRLNWEKMKVIEINE